MVNSLGRAANLFSILAGTAHNVITWPPATESDVATVDI